MRSTPLHRQVFKRGSTTYFTASLFFPADLRDDVFILYAFVRVADDCVDSVPQQPAEFRRFVEMYHAARDGHKSGDIIIDAFVDLERRKGLESSWTDAFLHSMELDLTKKMYSSLDESLEYVYGSAEVIGLCMARLMGLSPRADHSAKMLGRAMQFINFIRDIAEDYSLGRTYLPVGESQLNDLSETSARSNRAEFTTFMGRQLGRYRAWQREAEEGYRYIPRRYLIPIQTAADICTWTADQIARDPLVVFERKVKPSRLLIMGRIARNALFGNPNGFQAGKP